MYKLFVAFNQLLALTMHGRTLFPCVNTCTFLNKLRIFLINLLANLSKLWIELDHVNGKHFAYLCVLTYNKKLMKFGKSFLAGPGDRTCDHPLVSQMC